MKPNHVWVIEMLVKGRWKIYVEHLTRDEGRHNLRRFQRNLPPASMWRITKYVSTREE